MTELFKIRRLNHAVLYVSDLQRASTFYREVLGFEIMAETPAIDAVFLRAAGSENHHDLGLFGLGPDAKRPARGQIGLYHLAWQVDTIEELAAARHALIRVGAHVGEASHGATKSLYGTDPDGNEFEIMWMLPRSQWGHYEIAAPVAPLDLDDEVARWGNTAAPQEPG